MNRKRLIRLPRGGAPRTDSGAERGSTLVEFAIVLVVFLVLLFGIIDFSRALYTYHYVSAAARDASRWAAVNGYNCPDDSSCNGTGNMNNGRAYETDVSTYLKNNVSSAIDKNKITSTITYGNDSNGGTECDGSSATRNSPGCTVSVQVSYAFNFVAPIVSTQTLTLSSTSEMVIQH